MFKNKRTLVAVFTSLIVIVIATVYSVNASYRTKHQKNTASNYINNSKLSHQTNTSGTNTGDKITKSKNQSKNNQTKSKNTASLNKTYTVVQGDTLWDIARKFGTTPEALKSINGLDGDNLPIGKVLVLGETNKLASASQTKTSANSKKIGITTVSKKTSSRNRTQLASRGTLGAGRSVALSWSVVSHIFSSGSVALVKDVATGKSFYVKRTFGTNHADCEALTKEDSNIIKSIWGGWSWVRRPVVVQVGGKRIAASMTAMPHAGLDKYPALKTVNGRSGDYGRGTNLDAVKNNGMDGHFDIHFLNSARHKDGKVDSQHQAAIKQAVGK